MKIYSMTATFGKLNHETLTLQSGVNIVEAPNEWGKSTWCTFLLAMLYGIDTSSRSKKDFIADKERYAPWSGVPMSGRMDLNWRGRDITIERSSKGRSVFGQFKAYETASGLPVAELTAANCGQMLLGVEQSVFARAGFIRLKDMPVTQDESLRRRLNALVTTGDERDTSDDLAQKLKDLKNRCRFNRSGLLPQAETEQKELQQKLEEIESLQLQMRAIEKRQEEVKIYHGQLLVHKQALQYEDDRNFAGKVAMARAQLEIAQERVETLETVCESLPAPGELEQKKALLRQMQEQREALQMDIQMQPPAPQMPEGPAQFHGMEPREAVKQAEEDYREYEKWTGRIKRPKAFGWIAGLLCMAGGALQLALTRNWVLLVIGTVLTILGIVMQQGRKSRNHQLQMQAQMIARRYAPMEPESWVAEARRYEAARKQYESQWNAYMNDVHQLNVRVQLLTTDLEEMTGGLSISRCEQQIETQLQQHNAYADALREKSRLEEMVGAMESTHRQVTAPEEDDELTFTMEETDRILSDASVELRHLHQRLGQCQGRIEALGSADSLRQQLDRNQARIEELEKYHGAVVLAQEMLLQAKQELQRRFAPRISQRAQELFSRMTDGRYQRISLGEDLSVSTAAENEDVLRGSLWRSDGTADQLYLALRLAVAEELTPHAPLVLDDAFVRFDDHRLKEILKILKQSGEEKQVILFTCQSREKKIMEELS